MALPTELLNDNGVYVNFYLSDNKTPTSELYDRYNNEYAGLDTTSIYIIGEVK